MIAFLQALPAFLASLPEIFALLVRIMSLLERFAVWAKDRKFETLLSEIEDATDKLEKAKNAEEKLIAARDIVSVIRKL
jgi:hypothetical protein